MKITIKKESVLHDVANLAFVIADIHGNADAHAVHQTFDIVEEGNIDRVARIMGLAFSEIETVMSPVMSPRRLPSRLKDRSAVARDYSLTLRDDLCGEMAVEAVAIHRIMQEFMVCKVLADWLSVTLPSLSGIWKEKAQLCLTALREAVGRITPSTNRRTYRLRLLPI